MGDVVNLNRFRKAKIESEKTRVAAANRVKFGRTKTERANEAKAAERAKRRLDGHALDRDRPPEE